MTGKVRQEGRIIRALGGFYTVSAPDGSLWECRARGLFRKEKISPCVGDVVQVELTQPGEGYVVAIAPRRNHLARPPLANLDNMAVVVSVFSPAPNLQIIDTMLAIAEYKDIEPLLLITKCDLGDPGPLLDIYSHVGIPLATVSSETGEGVGGVVKLLQGKVTAFTGNSGVGKSSLLNRIDPELVLKTAKISEKLGRGRHTTRHVELFSLAAGGFVADTPGFSTVEISRFETIRKEELELCFREFAPFREKCRFVDCAHICEPGCAVLEAVQSGIIPLSRHETYVSLYSGAKLQKEWELT